MDELTGTQDSLPLGVGLLDGVISHVGLGRRKEGAEEGDRRQRLECHGAESGSERSWSCRGRSTEGCVGEGVECTDESLQTHMQREKRRGVREGVEVLVAKMGLSIPSMSSRRD